LPRLGPSTRRDFLEQLAGTTAAVPLGLHAQRAGTLSRQAPFVDGLCMLTDRIEDLRDAGLSAVIVDASGGEMKSQPDGTRAYVRTFAACSRSLSAVAKRLRDRPEHVVLASRASDLAEAAAAGKTAVVLQIQGGGEAVEGELARLETLHGLGLCVFQMTHHFDNALAGGALEKQPRGLTRLGFDAVARLNELGIVPDLSHASDQTARDVAKTSSKPVVISHGAARALCRNPRCAPDDVIRAVADSGGVVGIFMMTFWLTDDPAPPTLDTLTRQIRHVIKVGGLGAVGIANDFPVTGERSLAKLKNDNAEGVKNYHPWWVEIRERGVWGFEKLPTHVVVPELNDVRRLFTIQTALEKRGFNGEEIEKILGANWLRVLKASLG
jgi:microsomal dipeptidase-like Zn-dependent dipeptidase